MFLLLNRDSPQRPKSIPNGFSTFEPGIAFLGGSQLVVLDEPTSGLDRRAVFGAVRVSLLRGRLVPIVRGFLQMFSTCVKRVCSLVLCALANEDAICDLTGSLLPPCSLGAAEIHEATACHRGSSQEFTVSASAESFAELWDRYRRKQVFFSGAVNSLHG